MRLAPISPADIGKHWERIRAGLEVVHAKTAPDWIPEDLYVALDAGAATLFVADECDGFLILQKQQLGRHRSKLLVWVVHAPSEYAQWSAQVYPELERIAREIGAVRLEMQSPRKGWLRDPFWVAKETIFTHEI